MIQEIYEAMTDEDKKHATTMDFEQLKCEIDDDLQRFLDTIAFRPNIEYISIVDAVMTSVSDIIREGVRLIEERDA